MLPTNPLLNATAPTGPHLPTGTLRQYAAGTLAPAAQHRVEAHVLACPRCADILDGLLQTPPATTDQALAQLQQRLRRRVQHTTPAALPATRTRRQNRWLAPQLAAAATLLFGLLAGGWWTWQQRHATPSSTVAAHTQAPAAAEAPAVASQPTAAASAPAGLPPQVPATTPHHAPRPAVAALHRHQPARQQASSPDTAGTHRLAPAASAVVAAASVAASAPRQHQLSEVAVSGPDTVRNQLRGRVAGVTLAAPAPMALVRDRRMPAAPPVPPTPAVGYPSWREKIRREAAEFRPEEQPVSGSVQLRLLIGADGKIQEVRVLHGLREDYDAEAQRIVCDGPGWVPGIGGGKRATQAVDVAVPFQ